MIESNQGDNGGGEQWPINVVVAQYGRRHLSTIADSVLNACPKNKTIACVIYVKRGKYEKRVVIPKGVNQVFMYGDGPAHTIVTDSNTRDPKTLTTSFRAATFGKLLNINNMPPMSNFLVTTVLIRTTK